MSSKLLSVCPDPAPCSQCGTMVYPRTSGKRFYLPATCCRSCANKARSVWSQSGWIDSHGYRRFSRMEHGRKNNVLAHRVFMEEMLGRKLEKFETVHHKNGDRADNRPENLELWASRHGRGQRITDLMTEHAGIANGLLSIGG